MSDNDEPMLHELRVDAIQQLDSIRRMYGSGTLAAGVLASDLNRVAKLVVALEDRARKAETEKESAAKAERDQHERALKAEAELAELKGAVDPKLVARFEGYLDVVMGEMQPTSPRREAAERCRAMFATITAMAQKAAADAYKATPEPGENENDWGDAILAAARETFGEERVDRNPRPTFWLGALCAPWSTLDQKGSKP